MAHEDTHGFCGLYAQSCLEQKKLLSLTQEGADRSKKNQPKSEAEKMGAANLMTDNFEISNHTDIEYVWHFLI